MRELFFALGQKISKGQKASKRQKISKGQKALKAQLPIMISIALLAIAALISLETAWAQDNENQINTQQLPDSSFIYDVGIVDLSTADSYYDNQPVQVLGEVVGDAIKVTGNDDFRWITLAANDANSNATVSVYMSEENAALIDSFGKYGNTGTSLRVRGSYHLTCTEHEGLSDIHAEYVSVSERGETHRDVFDIAAFAPGGVAVIVGLTLLAVFYRAREGRR